MFTITGAAQNQLYHMRTQLSALKLELAGMKHSRGSVYAHIKCTYGLKGSKQEVFNQFKTYIENLTAELASEQENPTHD